MPAGYRAGVAQQPYTKYESDNDEIRVEYKRVDHAHSELGGGAWGGDRGGTWFSGCKGVVLRVLLFLVVFLLGLVLGCVLRRAAGVDQGGGEGSGEACARGRTRGGSYDYEVSDC